MGTRHRAPRGSARYGTLTAMAGRHQARPTVPRAGGGASKVPAVKPYFWAVKLLTTAMGEAVSDFLVKDWNKYAAVALGFVAVRGRHHLAVRRAAVPDLAVLVGGGDGGGVRHDVRGRHAHRAQPAVLGVGDVLRGPPGRDVHHLVPLRGHPRHPLDRHAAPRGVLLAGGHLHLRHGHGARRPVRHHAPPGLPRVGVRVHRADLRAARRVAARRQPGADLLGGVRADPADRRLVRGLLRHAQGHQRPGARARGRVRRDGDRDGGVLHLPVAVRHRPAGAAGTAPGAPP